MIRARISRLYHEHERIKIFLLLGAILLAIVLIAHNIFLDTYYVSQASKMGVSFSPTYATALGLDPKKAYQDILKDLPAKYLRIPAYWNEIEPFDSAQGKPFQFQELDYYINEAEKHQAKVILAVGYKLPRWPECRSPGWLNLDNEKVRQAKLLSMLRAVIAHFDKNQTISAYQVENEPFLAFGVCPKPDRKFIKAEVEYVRTLTEKPIIITDSGELQDWVTSMRMSDYFGTTMYRVVHNDIIGTFYYPLKPWFYRIKAQIIRTIFAPNTKKLFITELQAEPWETEFVSNIPIEKQVKDFPLAQLKENVSFAKKVGFEEIYLWGAEWWYYMKNQGHPQYWSFAKTLF